MSGGKRPSVFRCARCALVFKWPRPISEALHEAYNQADGAVWGAQRRPEFEFAQRMVRDCAHEALRVLDVGCNRGEFLGLLPPKVQRYGVEVNRTAAARASAAGAQVWENVSDIPDELSFHIITCFDVVEHIERPSDFVHALTNKLEPRGRLVISSGDADAFLAQRWPAVNWYFGNPEHVSFISESWLQQWVATTKGLRIESVMRFLHGKAHQGLLPGLKVLALKVWPTAYLACYTWAKRKLSPESALFLPGNGARIDHLCAVISRTDQASTLGGLH